VAPGCRFYRVPPLPSHAKPTNQPTNNKTNTFVTQALFIFPTKALAQDQLASLRRLAAAACSNAGAAAPGIDTYDGDTPKPQVGREMD
jgi:ATP-dependent helicase YprA (DUF1998 family)